MAGLSDIEWTDATWNPVSGCDILSPGCTHCYAMRMAARLQAMGHSAYEGVTRKVNGKPVWTGKVHLNYEALEIPLRWRKPRKIFVNSMSDLFQDGIPDEFIVRVWAVMARAPQHVFQVLTKRPENMRRILVENGLAVLPNVWLGTSVESRKYASRVADLRHVPAQVRFISYEPLLGLGRCGGDDGYPLGDCRRRVRPASAPDERGMGRGDSAAMRAAGRRLLLQAVGRDQQESDGPHLPEPDLGRLSRLRRRVMHHLSGM